MKKIAVVLVTCTLLFGSTVFAGLTKEGLMDNGKETCKEEINEIQIFSFPDIELGEKGKYVKIYAEGCENLRQTSYPILPYKTKVMTFPFGTKIDGIEIKTGEVITKQLDKKIMPAPNPVPLTFLSEKSPAFR